MANNDIYSLVATWDYEGNVIQNQFTYRASGGLTLAGSLAASFLSIVIPDIRELLVDDQVLVDIRVVNLNNPADFQTLVPGAPVTGADIDPPLPSRDAIRFFCPTTNLSIRQGSKRFGVTGKDFVIGSEVNGSPVYAALYGNLAASMATTLSAGAAGQSAVPIIVKRTKTIGPSGKPVYTIPPVALSGNHYVANPWSVDPLVSTQATRKLGRGA